MWRNSYLVTPLEMSLFQIHYVLHILPSTIFQICNSLPTNIHCPIAGLHYFSPDDVNYLLTSNSVSVRPFQSTAVHMIVFPKLKRIYFTPWFKHPSRSFHGFSMECKAVHELAPVYPAIITNKWIQRRDKQVNNLLFSICSMLLLIIVYPLLRTWPFPLC